MKNQLIRGVGATKAAREIKLNIQLIVISDGHKIGCRLIRD